VQAAPGQGRWTEGGWMQISWASQKLFGSLLRRAMPCQCPALQNGERNGLGFR